MCLPQTAIDEFKEAWKQSFEEELTDDQALMEGTSLLTLYGILLGIKRKKRLKTE